jgi:hypothetical protein
VSGVEVGGIPNGHFTIVPNAWLRDERLSWKAKGLLAYLSSHAEGYRVSQNQMLRQAADGRDSLLSGLAELEEAGYLVKLSRDRDDGGRYASYDYRLTVPGLPTEKAPKRSGDPTSAGNPTRVTHSGLPDPKKNKREDQEGTPSESPAVGAQLALVPDSSTPATRAKALGSLAKQVADEHVAACNGMANYLAVLGIVRRTLDVSAGGQSAAKSGAVPLYDAPRVRAALAALRAAGRPVTLQTMQATLDAGNNPRTVTRGGYGPPAPYRDPDPATDPDAFQGAF